jgi:hypothetical protein
LIWFGRRLPGEFRQLAGKDPGAVIVDADRHADSSRHEPDL